MEVNMNGERSSWEREQKGSLSYPSLRCHRHKDELVCCNVALENKLSEVI